MKRFRLGAAAVFLAAVSAYGTFAAADGLILGGPASKPGNSYNPRIYGPQDPVMANARTLMRGTVNDPGADLGSQDTQSSVSLVSLGGGKLVAAFGDTGSIDGNNYRAVGSAFSTNNGLSWMDTGTVPAFNPPRIVSVPALAADPALGRVYMATGPIVPGVGLPIWRSTNGGQSWLSTPADGLGNGFSSPGRALFAAIAVDTFTGTGKSNVYTCSFDAVGHIRFSRSTDKGITFTPVNGKLMGSGASYSCAVAVGPQHDVYVFYVQKPGATYQLVMQRSTNRGATFGAPVVIRNLQAPNSGALLPLMGSIVHSVTPSVAINPDPAKPGIYITYADSPNALPGADNGTIYLTYSKDRGATWSAPAVVDNSPRDQFMPAVGFASPGNLMVTYFSRSQDPANSFYHRRARIGKLTSTGSVAFNPSFQLGPNSPNVFGQDPIPMLAPIEAGWRDTVIGSGGKFMTAWSDSRTGDAFHSRQPDVRFAAIGAPVPTANLGVTLSAATTAMLPLEKRVVKAHITSAGGPSNDVFLSVVAPAGMSVSPPGGLDCTVTGRFLGCSLGALGTNKAMDVSFLVQADGTTGSRTLTALASTSSRDTLQTNNKATRSLSVSTASALTATYSTGNISTAIIDAGSVDIPITVPAGGTVLNVTAAVRLNHTWDEDVDMYLIDPTGRTVELSTDNGSSASNYGSGSNDCSGAPTTFSDTAATSITAGTAPFAGTYKPEGALSDFLGQDPRGTWKLRVTDDTVGDAGTVGCVKLSITRKP